MKIALAPDSLRSALMVYPPNVGNKMQAKSNNEPLTVRWNVKICGIRGSTTHCGDGLAETILGFFAAVGVSGENFSRKLECD